MGRSYSSSRPCWAWLGLVFRSVSFPSRLKSQRKKLPPLAARLAGTKWINTNKVTFEWDDKGRFFHSGKEREYQVIDDSRLKIVFGENHVDTLVFDAQLTSFEQFKQRELNFARFLRAKLSQEARPLKKLSVSDGGDRQG